LTFCGPPEGLALGFEAAATPVHGEVFAVPHGASLDQLDAFAPEQYERVQVAVATSAGAASVLPFLTTCFIASSSATRHSTSTAASAAGAKRAVRLQVSIASHSPLMEEAAAGMREALNAVTVHDPKIAMLANATATPIRTAAELRRELSDHLTTGVDWIAAIGATAAAGTQRYVEVGYGRVLSGLVKRIPSATGAEILTIDELPVSATTATATAAVAS
jgi:[acyl-carrier-protein] S-malonyltransferase